MADYVTERNWTALINVAVASKYAVELREDGYVIITPARPRHPSQELGAYKTEQQAWRGAARLAFSE